MRWVLRIAVALCALALALGAVEYLLLRGVLGYHGIVEAPIFAYDQELGWVLRPQVDVSSSELEFAITVRTDALGLRTRERADTPPSSRRRVLVAGDSFAFGWGVTGDQMLSARLEDALGARGLQTAVLNAGVPGYSTDQEYLLWRRLAPQVRPELVVLLLSSNDPPADNASSVRMSGAIYWKPFFRFKDGSLELRGVPVPDKQPTVVPSPVGPLKARLRPSAIYALQQQIRNRLVVYPAGDGQAEIDANGLSMTGAILAAFNRDIRAQGAKLLVVLIPSPAIRTPLEKICNREGIAFLDLGPTFEGRRDLTFKYDGHWNARGHQAAAGAVLTALVPLLP